MQAIILAAGMGRRLAELTRNNTKCMIEVNGVKLIDRVLTQLSALPLKRVVLVIGYEGNKLREYVGTQYKGLNISKIRSTIKPIIFTRCRSHATSCRRTTRYSSNRI